MNRKMLEDILWKAWFNVPPIKRKREEKHNEARARLNEDVEDASIIATNCVGGEISNALGLRFNSPFVNMSMDRNDLVDMALDLKTYMSSEPMVIKGKYITLRITNGKKDININYIHDDDADKVLSDYMRRRERINYDKVVLIIDDRSLTQDSLEKFDKIDCFRKVCLTSSEQPYECCHYLPQYKGQPCVGMYQSKTLSGVHGFENMWDYTSFLNGERK